VTGTLPNCYLNAIGSVTTLLRLRLTIGRLKLIWKPHVQISGVSRAYEVNPHRRAIFLLLTARGQAQAILLYACLGDA
jgi:hypothetical protein